MTDWRQQADTQDVNTVVTMETAAVDYNIDGNNGSSAANRGRPLRLIFKVILVVLLIIGCTAILTTNTPSNIMTRGTAVVVGLNLPSSVATAKDAFANHAMTSLSKLPSRMELQSMINDVHIMPALLGFNKADDNYHWWWSTTKATAVSFTVETAELAWEKSEALVQHLTGGSSSNEKSKEQEENGFARALEGLEGILHLRHRGGDRGSSGGGGGGGATIKQKAKLRATKLNQNARRQQVKKEQKQPQHKKNQGEWGNRIMKAVDVFSNEEEEQQQQKPGEGSSDFLSYVSKSPLAVTLLMATAFVFMIASFVSSPDSRRLNRLATSHEGRNIVLDEEEAEIVEFYEKELESGTFHRMLSLEVDLQEDINDDVNLVEDEAELRLSSEFNTSDTSLHSLTKGHDARRSLDDTYYARVLQDVEALGYEDDDVEADGQYELVDGEKCDQECQEMLPKEFKSDESPQEDCEEETSRFRTLNSSLDSQAVLEVVEDDEYDQDSRELHSASSISSLTTEMYSDIESTFSHSNSRDEDEETEEAQCTPLFLQLRALSATALSMVTGSERKSPSVVTPIRSQSAVELISPTAATPTKSNVCRDRRRREEEVETRPTLDRRRVSFSPDINVREVPRQQPNAVSSEKYIFIMLLAVGIAIAAFSYFPAHPTLSPITSMTTSEILHRADTLLNSQWDVEL